MSRVLAVVLGERSWPRHRLMLDSEYSSLDTTQVDRGCNRRCSATTCAVAPSADSRVHSFGSPLRASWCRLPQTNAECRVPTVRQPSPRRRVVRPARSRRTCASQMMGGATLQTCRENCYWQQSALAATRLHILTERTPAADACCGFQPQSWG